MITKVFLWTTCVAWFAFAGVPYLVIAYFTSIDFGGMGRLGTFDLPFVILYIVCGMLGAGVYYVVGRQVLLWLRLWDEDAARGQVPK